VRDIVFVALAVGFFAVATLFVHACNVVVGPGSGADEELR
jgi:hypothetical protein